MTACRYLTKIKVIALFNVK